MRDREREGAYTVAGRGCHGRLTNKIVLFVWLWGAARRCGGRLVHLDQTKTVKG